MTKLISKSKQRAIDIGIPFFTAIGNASEKAYLILFTLFVITILSHKSYWNDAGMTAVYYIRFGLYGIVNFGCAIYLFIILAEWKKLWQKTIRLILLAAVLLTATFLFSKSMTLESYIAIMTIYFCLLSYQKGFRRSLFILLACVAAMLLISWLGTVFGFAHDVTKYGREFGGHSYGLKYPNYWGYFTLLALILCWYLYLKDKTILTVALFWGVSVFMWTVVTCRTSAILTASFPFFAAIAEFLQRKNIRHRYPLLKVLIIVMPLFFFVITLILCWKMEWVQEAFYKTGLKTMAMRFVEGGYALRRDGISLFGLPFGDYEPDIVDASIKITQVMDNAYVSNLIQRGVIWMAAILGWLCFAHWTCIKNRDFRLLAISFTFLILALMERPALDVWYNIVLLYPLTTEQAASVKAQSAVL